MAAGLGLTMVLAACGQNAAAPSSGGRARPSAAPAAGGVKVGVILPETQSSARWEGFDKPLLTAAMQAEGLDADIQNAQGDEQKFSTLADGMISSGVKVLVIASISSESGAAVAAKAKAQGIPTIDYDRLSLGGTSDYYVSFDNEKVGALQGQGLADALKGKQGAQVIEIEGAPTDNNATLFSQRREDRAEAAVRLRRAQARAEARPSRTGTTRSAAPRSSRSSPRTAARSTASSPRTTASPAR